MIVDYSSGFVIVKDQNSIGIDKNVLTVDNGRWGFGCPNYSKEVIKAFKELIKDIEERFSVRIPSI